VRAEPFEAPSEAFARAVGADVAELEVAEARYIQSIGGSLAKREGGLVVSHPRLRHPAYNGVLNLTSTNEAFDEFIGSVEEQFGKMETPFSVVTSPVSRPANARARLEARGYRRSCRRMWMELTESVTQRPHDAQIAVRPTPDLDVWAQTAAAALGIPGHVDFLAGLAQESVRAPHQKLLLATHRGHPAGACEVTADNRVAFIRQFGVIEEYRSRGIAGALLASACEAVGDLKVVRMATRVFAGTGTELLLERYGFGRRHISEEYVKGSPGFPVD
jgi:GNAT superfamily N-acetyltransferase